MSETNNGMTFLWAERIEKKGEEQSSSFKKLDLKINLKKLVFKVGLKK